MSSSGDSDGILPSISDTTQRALEHQSERFESIAADSMSIFRINLLIMGIFVPAIALIARNGADVTKVLDYNLTRAGIVIWVISCGTCMWTYFFSRQFSVAQTQPYVDYLNGNNPLEFRRDVSSQLTEARSSSENITRYVIFALVTTVSATLLLAAGIIQFYINISTGGILYLILILSFIGMVLADALEASLRLPDYIRFLFTALLTGIANFASGILKLASEIRPIREIPGKVRTKYFDSEDSDNE